MENNEVKSPCIFVCRLDSKGICEGCKRTSKEIANWSNYSNSKKLEVINRINKYKNTNIEMENYYGDFPM